MAIEFREVTEPELSATLDARHRTTGRGGGRDDGMSAEEWSWLFARNPGGRRVFAAVDGARVLAQFALLPHRVWAGGKERVFSEVVESFEAEAGRGLYALTGKALFDGRAGSDCAETVAYGWPSAAEARACTRLLGFETVRTDPWLLGAVEPAEGDQAHSPSEVDELDEFGEDARWLWDRCSGDFAASTIRDADYLNWRFLQRPGHRYRVFGVRSEGVLRGYAVAAPASDPATFHLVDWLCPPDEVKVASALLARVRHAARSAGAIVIGGVIVPWSPWFEWFQGQGFQVHGRGRFLLARSFLRKFDDLWLRDGWWYTLADSLADSVAVADRG